MSNRTDKILSVVRYITKKTGIQGIGYHGPDSTLIAPWPYQFQVITDAKLRRITEQVRVMEDADPQQIPIIIRYDNYLDKPSNAWAVMRLETACELVRLHQDLLKGESNEPTNHV